METEILLPCLEQLITLLCLKPDESSQHLDSSFNIILSKFLTIVRSLVVGTVTFVICPEG
jgi:hypothetical protein